MSVEKFTICQSHNMTDIGSFGIVSFGNHVSYLMAIASSLSILCGLLFIVSLAGWTTDQNSIQSVSWTSVRISDLSSVVVVTQEYFGLQGYYSSITVSGIISSTFSLYSDCTTMSSSSSSSSVFSNSIQDDAAVNICPSCMNAGRTTFGLTFTSFFLNGIVGVGSLVRGCISNIGIVKILSMVGNVMAIFCSVAAFYVWHTRCYTLIEKQIKNNVPSTSTFILTTTAGFNTCVAGFVFLLIIFFIHTLTPSGTNNNNNNNSSNENKHVASLHEVYSPTSDERGSTFHSSVEKEETAL